MCSLWKNSLLNLWNLQKSSSRATNKRRAEGSNVLLCHILWNDSKQNRSSDQQPWTSTLQGKYGAMSLYTYRFTGDVCYMCKKSASHPFSTDLRTLSHVIPSRRTLPSMTSDLVWIRSLFAIPVLLLDVHPSRL